MIFVILLNCFLYRLWVSDVTAWLHHDLIILYNWTQLIWNGNFWFCNKSFGSQAKPWVPVEEQLCVQPGDSAAFAFVSLANLAVDEFLQLPVWERGVCVCVCSCGYTCTRVHHWTALLVVPYKLSTLIIKSPAWNLSSWVSWLARNP
jgi:hypothetical protein